MEPRLDHDAGNTLATFVHRLRSDMNEFKNRQRTSSRSGVLGYESETANAVDDTVAINVAQFDSVFYTYTITFTADGTQEFPFVDIFPVLDLSVTGISDGAASWDSPSLDKTTIADPLVTKWKLHLEVTGNFGVVTAITGSASLKVHVVGSTRGTINVSRTP